MRRWSGGASSSLNLSASAHAAQGHEHEGRRNRSQPARPTIIRPRYHSSMAAILLIWAGIGDPADLDAKRLPPLFRGASRKARFGRSAVRTCSQRTQRSLALSGSDYGGIVPPRLLRDEPAVETPDW
jgi:hypothetical protein